jgi:glycosyltransferase involved in cell wall biosynthesis
MTLDIIVTHYKEPWELCRYLFNSIAMQELVDWSNVRVLVVNDGDDDSLDAIDFSVYPFEVDYIKRPHSGVSATRNAGLDASDADYVMFCDADDGFLNNLALFLLFQEMDDGQPALINPTFIEEAKASVDGSAKDILCIHRADATFIHGKAYNLDFLRKYNIRFPDGINLHEDSYFNSLVVALGNGSIHEISNPMYLWRFNPNSVVRHEDDFLVRTYPDLVEVWNRICLYFKTARMETELKAMVCKFILSAFYTFQLGTFMAPRNEKYRRIAHKAVSEWFRKYRKIFYGCGDKMVSDYVKVLRKDAEQNGLLFERIDLNSWLSKLK